MSILCLGCKITRQHSLIFQVRTLLAYMDISWSLTISWMFSSFGTILHNWSCLTSIICGVRQWVLCGPIHEGRHSPPKVDRFCAMHVTKRCTRKYWPQVYLVQSRPWGKSQRNFKTQTERHSRGWKSTVVQTTRTQRSRKKGSICLLITRTYILNGSLKYITIKELWFFSTTVKYTQWDTNSRCI